VKKQTNNQTDIEPFDSTKIVESLVVKGDISGLSPDEKARYYLQMCASLGLNPASHPLAFLKLQGRETLYASRGATDQLAAIHKLNREIIDGPKLIEFGGMKMVYAQARVTHPNGRSETATATLPLTDPVNVLMKCETKAKRRATLSILGLGMLDESELETLPIHYEQSTSLPSLFEETTEKPRELQPPSKETPQLPAKTIVDELFQGWLSVCGEKPTPLQAGRFIVDHKSNMTTSDVALLSKAIASALPQGTTAAQLRNGVLFAEIDDDLKLCKKFEEFQACWQHHQGSVTPLAKGIRSAIEMKFRTSARAAGVKEEHLDWVFRSKDPEDFYLEEMIEKIQAKTDCWDIAGSFVKRRNQLGKNKELAKTHVLNKLKEVGLTEFEAISCIETSERRVMGAGTTTTQQST